MAVKGLGTLLKINTGTTESPTWTALLNRVKLDGPSFEVGTVETTSLDSTWEEHIPTIPKIGELSGSGLYNPSDVTASRFHGKLTTPVVVGFQLIFADTGSTFWQFDGILTKFQPNGMETTGRLGFDFTIMGTGAPTVPVPA